MKPAVQNAAPESVTVSVGSAARGRTRDNEHKRILVIGGTGVVGKPIVEQLDAAGWTVRVASRHASEARGTFGPHVELVSGDASDAAHLRCAMTGCQAVLICVGDLLDPYLDLRVTRNVVAAAPDLGIDRIGLISGPSVAEERRSFPGIDSKYQAEELLKQSSIPWVIIRPTWPMESLARFVQGRRASVLGKQPATIYPLAGSDLGRMVVRAIELDEAVGQTFTLFGPQAYTMKQWLEEYCALCHPGVHVNSVPLWVLSVVATINRNATLKAVVELMRYFETLPEVGDPTLANRILGPARITLQEWAGGRPDAAAVRTSLQEVRHAS
jgi:uncharacterized protein YbjT (DUF2867 family)